MKAEETLLTTKEVAKRLEIHPQTLVNWRWAHRGPSFVMRGRNVFYKLSVVRAWKSATA